MKLCRAAIPQSLLDHALETQWVPFAVLLQRKIWTALPVAGLLGFERPVKENLTPLKLGSDLPISAAAPAVGLGKRAKNRWHSCDR